jgi:hypothetical protein
MKQKIKFKVIASLPEVKKKAQRVVNKYIKLRDLHKPCVSCLKMGMNMQAGHYIAQGSSGALRYDEDNIHGQCIPCNMYLHGNLINYRINLVYRIGEDGVKRLEDHRHDIKKWTRDELQEVIDTYNLKLKELNEKVS